MTESRIRFQIKQ